MVLVNHMEFRAQDEFTTSLELEDEDRLVFISYRVKMRRDIQRERADAAG